MLKELSAYIHDLARYLIEPGAEELNIEIDEEPSNDLLTIVISNDINWQTTYSARKPSAAIPLLRQACDLCGGRLIIKHSAQGSKLTASMRYFHADRPPMGSLPDLIQEIIMSAPDTRVSYTHRYDGREYQISTSAIKAMLEGVPMDTPPVAQWLREKIGEGLAHIMQEKVLE